MSTPLCFQNSEHALCYNQNSSLQYQWGKSLIDTYTEIIAVSHKIMDIGCGDGKITANILAKVAPNSQIIGLDLSLSMINLAIEKYSLNHKNISFMVDNVENIVFEHEFDTIFSCCCLQWLQNQRSALKKIAHSMISGGNLFIVIPGKTPNNIFPLGKITAASVKWNHYFINFVHPIRSYYTKEEYTNILLDAGLIPKKIELVNNETIFDIDKLRDWIKPICSYYEYLPPDLKEEFLNDIVDQLVKSYPTNNQNQIILSFVKLEVHAVKN